MSLNKTEEEKFKIWLKRQKENGLQGIHISIDNKELEECSARKKRERIFKALNDLNSAVERGDCVPLNNI